MEFFVGLDVSLDETHICVIDEGGRIIKETRAESEPTAIAKAIRHQGRRIEHVGLGRDHSRKDIDCGPCCR